MKARHDIYWTQGLHRALQQQPDGIATIFGERTRTFTEQADRVARLAGALRELGVRDGARVGILGLNSDRLAEAALAIPWADGVIDVVDIVRAPFEMAPMLAEAETSILLVDDAFAGFVPQIRAAYAGLRSVIHMGDGPPPADTTAFEALIAGTAPVPDARRGGDELAALVHTGGTTELPKAVMHTGGSMLSLAQAFGATLPEFVRPGTRLLQVTPMSHVSGVGTCLATSQYGNTLVPLPRFDPAVVLEMVEAHRITAMFVVPSMLQQVVDHPDAARRDLDSLRLVFYGGSPITERLLERTEAVFPHAGFGQVYGMTETMSCTLMTPADHRPGPQRRSAGRTAIHSELRVVDADDVDVPTGTPGEILLRGPGVMQGYWNDPDATTQVLRGGWVHTGDIGYLDEAGYVYVVDRVKDVIVVGGDNVHSTEVENALASHHDVAACAVIGVPDDGTGEQVHAVVVPRPGASPDPEQLAKHCAAYLAEFKVPKGWEFVEALPTSPTGKVLKRELRKPHWEGRERQVN
ncbi:AMP-binding protein [Solicola gregarius]|uniref:AMP-binding protein n=1 Tax=Solicola gregarius TaxID=2908642 RepID=A0AA46YMC8_9ACTN|nr:AMP-binding protein [Solicola gregarius]UYM06401.1 AMP-binding protein [Solicola gregarius]